MRKDNDPKPIPRGESIAEAERETPPRPVPQEEFGAHRDKIYGSARREKAERVDNVPPRRRRGRGKSTKEELESWLKRNSE